MDHDVKRVVAAGVASIHVLLQQNYARRAATNYPGCWKRLEGRGDVARHRSCAVMRPRNIDCAIFSGGCVEWIRQTQLDFDSRLFRYRHLAFASLSAHLAFAPKAIDGSARASRDAGRPSNSKAFGRPGNARLAEREELGSNLLRGRRTRNCAKLGRPGSWLAFERINPWPSRRSELLSHLADAPALTVSVPLGSCRSHY